MKAKDYFDKYGAEMYAEWLMIAEPGKLGPMGQEFLKEFSIETQELAKKRGVKRIGALKAVVLDQNEKWNALCRIFHQQYGECPLVENGWRNLIRAQCPELFQIKM